MSLYVRLMNLGRLVHGHISAATELGAVHRRRRSACGVGMALVAVLSSVALSSVPARAATGSEFSGVLVEGDSTPIVGRTLVLTDSASNQFTRTTDATGAFFFNVLAGRYTLTAGGLTTGGQQFALAGSVDLTASIAGVALSVPISTLPVAVRDAVGVPVAGASVSLASVSCGDLRTPLGLQLTESLDPGGPGMTGVTDAVGMVRVTSLTCGPTGGASITVSAPGFLAQNFNVYDLSGSVVAVTLHRTTEVFALGGRLTDRVGSPIAQAPVTVTAPASTDAIATAVTGADGSYSFDLPVGDYSVRFTNPPTSPVTFTASDSVQLTGPATLATAAGLVPAELAVVDSSGMPYAGATVVPTSFLCGRDFANQVAAFQVNPAGVVPPLTVDGTVVIEVPYCAPEPFFGQRGRYSFQITPVVGSLPQVVAVSSMSGATRVPVTLARFSGSIAGTDGAGVGGLPIDLLAVGTTGHSTLTTAADGTFAADLLPASYAFNAVIPMGGVTFSMAGTVALSAASVTGFTVAVQRSSLPVVVRDVDGLPLEGATVTTRYLSCIQPALPTGVFVGISASPDATVGSVTTDGAGFAEAVSTPCPVNAGSATVDVAAPGFLAQTFNVNDLSGSPFLVTLHRPTEVFTLSGRFTDDIGNPMSDVVVTVRPYGSPDPYAATVTSADGSYSINLPTGRYLVAFTNSATSPVAFDVGASVQLTGPTIQSATVRLAPVTFTVVDPSGRPLAGSAVLPVSFFCGPIPTNNLVRALPVNPAAVAPSAGADGTVTLEVPNCPPSPQNFPKGGTYVFTVTPPTGYAPQTVTIPPLNGATSLTVTVVPVFVFSGVVTDDAGVGLAGIAINLTPFNSPTRTVKMTAADGSFAFSAPPGGYSFDATASTAGVNYGVSGSVSLQANVTGVVVAIHGAPLPVVVLDSANAPIPGASVQSSSVACVYTTVDVSISVSVTGNQAAAPSDASGQTSMPSIRCAPNDGRATLDVTAAGYLPRQFYTSDLSGPTFSAKLIRIDELVTHSGVIVDAVGTPIAGAQVTVTAGALADPVLASTVSASDGSFAVTVAAGSYVLWLTSTVPGPSPFPASFNFHLAYPRTDLYLSVPRVAVTFVLTGTGGAPVPGTTMAPTLISCPTRFGPIPVITQPGSPQVSDLAGTVTFWLPLCRPFPLSQRVGTYKFLISPPVDYAEQFFTMNFVEGPKTVPISLASLSGRVLTQEGAPLPAQTVTLQSATGSTVSTDSSTNAGGFAVSGPSGIYTVGIGGAFGDPTTYQVAIANVDLTTPRHADLVLPIANATLRVSRLGGRAIAGASILMTCTPTTFPLLGGTANGSECATETTDANGDAILSFLPTDSATITVRPPAGSDVFPETIVIHPTAGLVVPVTLGRPPAFTSAPAGTLTVGTTANLTVAADGVSTPTISLEGRLPAGVQFLDHGDGTASLAGTPAVGSGGLYPLTFTAVNPKGAHSQSFTLVVREAPMFTSPSAATFHVGSAGTFTTIAVGYGTASLTLSGPLPTGVTFTDSGTGTGLLAGTPAAGTAREYPLTITATNEVGIRTQTFTLTVDQPPVITSAATTTFSTGRAGSYTITTTGVPAAALSEAGALPTGLTLASSSNGTARLAGTPAPGSGGSYTLTLTAVNTAGSATQSFTLIVRQPPQFTSQPTARFHLGEPNVFTVVASGFPSPTFATLGSLPAGVTFTDKHNGTAVLAGTPAPGTAKNYPIVIATTNPAGAAAQVFTLIIDQRPTITTGPATTFAAGKASSFTILSDGSPIPSVTVTGILPPGVRVANNTNGSATISGSPALGSGGTYHLAITASSVAGSAAQSFTLTVNQAPSITSANTTTFRVGTAGDFTITTSAAPTATITITGILPAGVNFVDNHNGTGRIAGVPAAGTAKTYRVTINATNPAGSVTQTVTIVVR